MTRNPLYNALLAIAYVIGVILLIFSGTFFFGSQEDSIFIPMAMLGLLVLSVTVMAYLFFYQPLIMLLDGERDKGVKLFLQTIGIFAGAIVVVLILSFLTPGLGN